MRVTRSRLLLAFRVLVACTCTVMPSLRAQSGPERPYAALTKLPSLVSELWPADFNEDGVTDLVAGRSGGSVIVRAGGGDGTFLNEHVIASGLGTPIGVGDVNRDGHIDVIVSAAPLGVDATYILPGRGDGTFGDPVQPGIVLAPPVSVLDMDGDGLRDLVGLGMDSVRVYRGRGDFTFDDAVILRTDIVVEGFSVTDVNGDRLTDVAAITADGRAIDVFLNQGGLTFARTAIPLAHLGLGVTARDMNRDGLVDLIASVGDLKVSAASTWISGFVLVFLGHGDGTFDEPLSFATNNGPRTVVAGDFNGDGLPDIATGNLSYGNACEASTHLWDSISILPGFGDGRLGPPASYSLGNTEDYPDILLYRHAHHRLNTSDLNGDGRTDLIASPGAILLATSAAENRPPRADAGEAVHAPASETIALNGSAIDPDHDWLSFEWADSLGRVVGTVPRPCVAGYVGDQTFTLTVRDGHGGVSTDSVTHTFGSPQPLPPGWASDEIGDTSGGYSTFFGPSYTVAGDGADIWGASDAFHYVHSIVAGNFDVTVRVSSVEHLDDWTKAGLMIRDGLAADARHAFLFVTPSANGTAFQRRPTPGALTIHTSGPPANAPVWLRLRRDGDAVSAFVRRSTADAWTLVDTQMLAALPRNIEVGLAVTSHVAGATAKATFDSLAITPLTPLLPEGWTNGDIGNVAASGHAAYDGGMFTVSGSGADIWNTSDAFHYAHTIMAGDFDVMARVTAVDNVHEWTKAGLMMRDGLSAGARHAFVFATPTARNGVAFQRRPAAGEPTVHTPGPLTGPPTWLRLRREGERVSAFARTPTDTEWALIDTQTFSGLPESVELGLAVTSHQDGTIATAVFDNVGLTPGEWTSGDVGSPGLPGSTTVVNGTYTLTGSGHDIWATSDAFQFTHQTLSGDGSVTARVATLQGGDPWTKAGVMIRASEDPSSAHAFMFVSLSEGLAFQRRVVDGAVTTHTSGGGATAPYWVRLTRVDAVITAFISQDGVSWVTVGSDTFPSMPHDVLAGLAVTSHDDTALATASFDQLAVLSAQTPPLSLVSPSPGNALRHTTVTFEWSGAGDEFWLDVGTTPGSSDVYSSGSLGQVMRHTVTSLPLNGTPLYVQVRRRIGATTDMVTVQYTAPVFRGLAVITDFRDRHLEDFTGAGMKNEDDVAQQLRKMEDHWTFLSRGLETVKWEIIRIELPYDSPDSDPDPFHGDWNAFRNAAALEIQKQVSMPDYDVNSDGVLDASWLIVSHGGLNIQSAIGGSSRNLNVNMFADGQASLSVTSGATGNFNHELGHLRGLPDTYGTYDTLHGLTLMSYSWPVPPHDFSAFERVRLGWVKPRVISETTRGVWLPPAHDALTAVMIRTGQPNEYFLLEYRRRPDSGYGSSYFLPYNGLVVYHVFEGSDNWRSPPLVQLEPADGMNTYDGILHPDDFISPDNLVLLRPLIVRSYFGARPEIFRIENVQWSDGGIMFDLIMPADGSP